MLHPYLLEIIQAHWFLFYTFMGLANFCFCAWMEGRENTKDGDKGVMSMAGGILWPLFFIGYVVWGLMELWEVCFKAGKKAP